MLRAVQFYLRAHDMDAVKVFLIAALAYVTDTLFWVPDALKFIILLATTVYVVYKMMREMRKFYIEKIGKDGDE